MDKQSLNPPEWAEPRVRSRLSKWKLFGAGILTVAALHWLTPHMHCSHQRHQHHHATYAGENIEWKPCGEISNRTVECSKIDVPMDQFNPDASNKTFNVPLIRMRGKDGSPNVLLNPGGPGGSGFEFLHRRGEQLSTIVGDGFHLVSFDPRGINSSSPRASCYPSKEARRELGSVHDADIVKDGAEVFAWTHNYVRACEDTMGEHGKYINTPQTAADMNSILDALGQKDMYYWGFSYGTLLGQTYATLFPERSHRVIIDGVVNQFLWYQARFDGEDLTDTENVMDGLFKECIKSGDSCPLSSMAKSWEGLKDKFMSFVGDLKEQPMNVYVNNSVYGLLDYQRIWYGALFPVLYKPERWHTFAKTMEQLLNGNATQALMDYGLDGEDNADALYTVSMNDGASGPLHWPQDLNGLLDIVTPTFNRSIFAPDDLVYLFAKQQWRIPKTHNYVPRYGVKTAHPLLILTTTYDPVCPLVSARTALAAFEGSRLIEVKGYGHCSVAVPSLCLAKHVRGFLYNGTLPDKAAETQCEVDGPYFKPNDTASVMSFDDPEDQAIHLAQLELARDPDWPRRLRA
ncbi:hypothetical protein F53441_11738 [Fusarium austroafricanum]|uniref:AB hydrolase-1 domain-containing protein n=1 Tax=Fusarium austroafricanum TaxID=2364996 RepID=A0A8H4K2M3_9HYPO|nr:hypothetical protein F53441_11738 [Fusarium austroafricanum]